MFLLWNIRFVNLTQCNFSEKNGKLWVGSHVYRSTIPNFTKIWLSASVLALVLALLHPAISTSKKPTLYGQPLLLTDTLKHLLKHFLWNETLTWSTSATTKLLRGVAHSFKTKKKGARCKYCEIFVMIWLIWLNGTKKYCSWCCYYWYHHSMYLDTNTHKRRTKWSCSFRFFYFSIFLYQKYKKREKKIK